MNAKMKKILKWISLMWKRKEAPTIYIIGGDTVDSIDEYITPQEEVLSTISHQTV